MKNADSLDPPLKFFWIISYLKKNGLWKTPRPIFPLLPLGDFKCFFASLKKSLVTSMECVYHPKETTVYMVYVWFNMHKTIDFALPFVMAWYLSNTSLFVVSWILIDNAKSESNLYNTMYIHEAKKSYMCTDLNLLCLHTNCGYFNVFHQVFLRYRIADDFVYVVMKRGCLHLARQIWHPMDWLIDSVHGFPAVMIGTCSDHLNRYSRCLQHVDVLFLIVLCLLGVFSPIHFCLCWSEFSIATNKIFFKRFSSYVHSSSYYSLLHFF